MKAQLQTAIWALFLILFFPALSRATDPNESFRAGLQAYRAGDYQQAREFFRESASAQPASGTLQNLGLSQWQCGRVGPAILSWEQCLWLDPFNDAARKNARFARKAA